MELYGASQSKAEKKTQMCKRVRKCMNRVHPAVLASAEECLTDRRMILFFYAKLVHFGRVLMRFC